MSLQSHKNFPLVDHHCHGLMPHDLSADQFEDAISEAFAPAPPGTSHWDKPVALSIRRWCAPILDLPPFPAPEDYVARRAEIGATEVNKRFLRAAELDTVLVDSGNRPDELCSVKEVGELAGAKSKEIIRIESVAERLVARGGILAQDYSVALEAELRDALHSNVVGLKTIVAYRSSLAINYSAPDKTEIHGSVDKWLSQVEKTKVVRITDPILERHLLWLGADIAREMQFPMQFHIGIGDPDIQLNKVDPSLLTPFIRAVEDWKFPIALLHCYPFHRQAGLMAENFPFVYFDVGFVQNWVGPSYQRIMEESLELAPFTKQLYSSDAFGLSELYYLGALRFRTSLANILSDWVAKDELVAGELKRIITFIGRDNSRRIYPLEN